MIRLGCGFGTLVMNHDLEVNLDGDTKMDLVLYSQCILSS